MVTGKGGVGKSAMAAALGKVLAETRRVLVLEMDPRENVHQLFGAPPSDGDFVDLGDRLYLQNLKPGEVLDQLVVERLRFGAVARRVLESPIYRRFVEGAPGLEELAILGHALRVVRGLARKAPAVDTVILDAPATGHGLSLLAAPFLVSEVIRSGPIAEMNREVRDWLADPDRVGVLAVTLAEEMPVTESLELADELRRRLGRAPEVLAVNGLYPEVDRADEVLTDELPLWELRRRVNDAELARLRADWTGPWVEIPLLPIERGPRLCRALAELLSEGLTEVLPGEVEP